MVKITDFLIDSRGIDKETDTRLRIEGHGDFIELKNNIVVDLYITESKEYTKKNKVFVGLWWEWKTTENSVVATEHILKPGDTKRWIVQERSEDKEKVSTNYNITLTGIGEKGEGYSHDPDITPGKEKTLWDYITPFQLIMVVFVISLGAGVFIAWKRGWFK